MAAPNDDFYSSLGGTTIYAGKTAPAAAGVFKTITATRTGNFYGPTNEPGGYVSLLLHGSSGGNYTNGNQWTVTRDAGPHLDLPWKFVLETPYLTKDIIIKPTDNQVRNSSVMETYWLGWTENGSSPLYLYTEELVDSMMDWFDANYPNASTTKRVILGGSMGAWGSTSYGIRRPDRFAAIFASRPRLRYTGAGNVISIPDWSLGFGRTYSPSTAPAVVGKGVSAAQYLDIVSYVANPANRIPFYLWCLGRNDGFANFQDSVDMVTALRATNRGFAFSWSDGDHSTGDTLLSQVQSTYTYDLFELGRGYPILSNSSRDQDPAVDIAGGINLGFKWRNIVETSGGWSCDLSNTLGVTTVTVRPHSDIFTTAVTPKTITIPAGQWVGVSFP